MTQISLNLKLVGFSYIDLLRLHLQKDEDPLISYYFIHDILGTPLLVSPTAFNVLNLPYHGIWNAQGQDILNLPTLFFILKIGTNYAFLLMKQII